MGSIRAAGGVDMGVVVGVLGVWETTGGVGVGALVGAEWVTTRG